MMKFPTVNGTEVLMRPPGNETVDLLNPTKDTFNIQSCYWALGIEFPVAVLFVAQRMYAAFFILRKPRVDDYMLLLAFALTTAAMSMALWGLTHGLTGVHIWEMSLEAADKSTMILYVSSLVIFPGTVLAKLVVCIFYYRLSPDAWYRIAIGLTAGTTIAGCVSTWLATLLACTPMNASWSLQVLLSTGHACVDRPAIYLAQAVIGAVTDLFLMLAPIHTVIGLQMPPRHKMAVIAWFSTGLVTMGAAIARVVTVRDIQGLDYTWGETRTLLWLMVEANLILVCASLPTFRVFLQRVAPWVLGDVSGTGQSSSNKRARGGGSGSADNRANGMRYALRTFGSAEPRRRRFDTIDDLEHGDDVYGVNDSVASDVGLDGKVAVVVRNSSKARRSPPTQDSDEEAIIHQTRSVETSSSSRR